MADRGQLSFLFVLVDRGGRGLALLCAVVMAGVNGLVFPLARLLSFGGNRFVPFWFNLLWIAANGVLFAFLLTGCVAFEDRRLELFCLGGGVFMTLLHVLILIGRIFVILEDNSVMNGLLREKYRIFPGHVLYASGWALAASTIFYALFGIFVLWQAERLFPGLMALYPQGVCGNVGCHVGFWNWSVLFLFKGVPFAGQIFDLLAIHPKIEFAVGPARLVAALIFVLNAVLLYYAVVLYVRQWYHLYALFLALSNECVGEQCRADIPVLQRRMTRAPDKVKQKVLQIAIHGRSLRIRRRAISIALHAKILTFPQTFIHNLHKEKEESNKLWGVRVAGKLLEDEELGPVYTRAHMDVLIRKIDHQLKRNRGRKHSDKVKEKLRELQAEARLKIRNLPRG